VREKRTPTCDLVKAATAGRLDSFLMRTNWFIAALVVGVASIVIAAIAMRLS
jgi:hypothetical protein